jgi:hypothetical protein
VAEGGGDLVERLAGLGGTIVPVGDLGGAVAVEWWQVLGRSPVALPVTVR